MAPAEASATASSASGLIEYPASAGDADKVLEAAIEAGAEDVESDEGGHRIWTSIESLHEVAARSSRARRRRRRQARVETSTEVEVRGDDAAQLMKLIDALEEDDDVQTVWGNYDVPEDELEKLGAEVCTLGLDPGPLGNRPAGG